MDDQGLAAASEREHRQVSARGVELRGGSAFDSKGAFTGPGGAGGDGGAGGGLRTEKSTDERVVSAWFVCASARARVRAPRLRRWRGHQLEAFFERRIEKKRASDGASGAHDCHHQRADQPESHGVRQHVFVRDVADGRIGREIADDGGRR